MGKKALCILRHEFERLVKEHPVNTINYHDDTVKIYELSDGTVAAFNYLHRDLQDRDTCETDPSFLQLIPYVTVIDSDCNILTYLRGSKGNEDRLHGKHSLGFGGHIEETATGSLNKLIIDTAVRELEEELGVKINFDAILSSHKLTLIQSFDAVGSVHLGVQMTVMVDRNKLGQEELDVIVDPEFYSLEALVKASEDKTLRLEDWSLGVLAFMADGMFIEA